MADDTPSADPHALVEAASKIVAAYIRNNAVQPADVPGLLAAVHGALAGLGRPAEPIPAPAKPVPPVPIKRSVTDEHVVSLEDGKPYKTLKRHLGTLGLTPEAYRAKWGLPADYPMMAPAYSRKRSAMAKAMGLGAIRRKQ